METKRPRGILSRKENVNLILDDSEPIELVILKKLMN